MKKVMLLLAALLAVKLAAAQNIPPMYGIMKMTYRASSFEMVEDYYGGLLGFEKAFEYRSQEGKVLSYKVNDRQFLEFIEDAQAARKDRFVSISIQTPDVGAMREYLLSRDVAVSQVTIDGAGNRVCSAVDNRGHKVEFIDLNPSSLHSKSAGRFLSARRISARIHHAGLFLNDIGEPPHFWTNVLGFKELLRIPADRSLPPAIVYYAMPGNTECIESYSNGVSEPGRDFEHPCLLVADMQAAIDTLRLRDESGRAFAPSVGRTGRWLLNIANPDGTRVEFTEAHPVR